MMTEEQWNAVLKEKNDLIGIQAVEIGHLRAALKEICDIYTAPYCPPGQATVYGIASLAFASYMSSNRWLRQTDDGSIVPGYTP
jgi:hypothetical protein